MQISLTKKLADVMCAKPKASDNQINPLFCWTANWTNVFDRRKEDLVVLVNNATRFTVAIYGIKRNQFKDIDKKIIAAIRNTFSELNINLEIIEDYFKQAKEIEYSSNTDRKLTSWVNSGGRDAAFFIGHEINHSIVKIRYNDTIGALISQNIVNYSKSFTDSFKPAEAMIKALSSLTNKPIYNYQAYELFITLDLEIYKAIRKIIVPSNIKMEKLHSLIQDVFDWKNYHLYEFAMYENGKEQPTELLTPDEESLSYCSNAVKLTGQTLSEYFPKYKKIIYTYDMGDNWQHEIQLLRVIENHNQDSPYLLEANGQTPPEDVGGIGGFIEFRNIMQNPKDPEYEETKAWGGYWSIELSEWKKRPRIIRE